MQEDDKLILPRPRPPMLQARPLLGCLQQRLLCHLSKSVWILLLQKN